MRCKYCNKKLEPHQYKWNEQRNEWVETCEGRCVLSDSDIAAMNGDSPDDGGNEDVVNTWVPED